MRLLLGLLALALLLPGCSDNGDGDSTPSPSTSGTTSTGPNPGILPQESEVSLTVAAVGAYPVNPAFDPATLQAPAGALVHMTFRNQDSVPITHNWVIDDVPDASSGNIATGQESMWDFTAPLEAGDYVYYCSIGDHRARGMEGTFTVTVS